MKSDKVGVIETSDSTLSRGVMEAAGRPETEIESVVPRIYESDAKGNLKAVHEYTVEHHKQVEGDIAQASVDYIKRHANKDTSARAGEMRIDGDLKRLEDPKLGLLSKNPPRRLECRPHSAATPQVALLYRSGLQTSPDH